MRELIENLLLTGIPLLIVLFWYSSMRARERAITVSRLTCKNYQGQLLGQTVSLKKIGIQRDPRGRLQFKRHYHFEYSYDGEERLQGFVTMNGPFSELVKLEPKPDIQTIIN